MICDFRHIVILHFVTYLSVIENLYETLDEDRKQITEQLIFQFGKLQLFCDKIGEYPVKRRNVRRTASASKATIPCIQTS